jgi:hypothetical protein
MTVFRDYGRSVWKPAAASVSEGPLAAHAHHARDTPELMGLSKLLNRLPPVVSSN